MPGWNVPGAGWLLGGGFLRLLRVRFLRVRILRVRFLGWRSLSLWHLSMGVWRAGLKILRARGNARQGERKRGGGDESFQGGHA